MYNKVINRLNIVLVFGMFIMLALYFGNILLKIGKSVFVFEKNG